MPTNFVILTGNACQEPTINHTRTGIPATEFTLAVTQRWRNRTTNQWEENTAFVPVKAYKGLAEAIVETITKGTQVIVEGKIGMDRWADRKTGDQRQRLYVLADSVTVVTRGKGQPRRQTKANGAKPATWPNPEPPPVEPETVPAIAETPDQDPGDLPF